MGTQFPDWSTLFPKRGSSKKNQVPFSGNEVLHSGNRAHSGNRGLMYVYTRRKKTGPLFRKPGTSFGKPGPFGKQGSYICTCIDIESSQIRRFSTKYKCHGLRNILPCRVHYIMKAEFVARPGIEPYQTV